MPRLKIIETIYLTRNLINEILIKKKFIFLRQKVFSLLIWSKISLYITTIQEIGVPYNHLIL